MKEMYLDANAHLPMNPKALQAYVDFMNSPAAHGHPSAPALPGRLAANALEIARGKIASLIGAEKPSQIVFTSTCTQACEWGLEILAQIDENKFLNIYSSPIEHPAVRDFFEDLSSEFFLPVNSDGVIQPLSTSNNKVCCIHVQNEIGTIQPLDQIKCQYLFSDMSQSLGKIPINLSQMNVDIAAFAAHKFGGPSFGFMYVRDINWWQAHGAGSRYFFDRAGTPDVAGAVATSIALEEAISSLETRTKNMIAFQSTLETGLESFGAEIMGKNTPRSPNTTFAYLPNKAFSAILALSERGIYTGLGSACGSMHSGPSKLVSTLGRPGNAHDFIRISQFGEYNDADAKYFLEKLNEVA